MKKLHKLVLFSLLISLVLPTFVFAAWWDNFPWANEINNLINKLAKIQTYSSSTVDHIQNTPTKSVILQQDLESNLIKKLAKHILLPKDEKPVIATINDAASLAKDQIFYKDAENGDVVFVFQKAAKAIIYSPDRDIIINVGPIFLQDKQTPVKTETTSTGNAEQTQISILLAKVGKLTTLPTGEQPVVATINDAAALIKDQPFYKGAVNGDVVLVYQKAAKAIVYSPSRNTIVNVGPIFLQNQ